jgi:glycosyltransferase involved in cell wall biosynthesis
MRIALVVPGGVDPSGEQRVIPALLALMRRLTVRHQVCVFALHQEDRPGSWDLLGARVINIGASRTRWRAVRAIVAEHRRAPFAVVHAVWASEPGLVAVAAGHWLGIPSLVHLGGGELVALPELDYGGARTWRARFRERAVLRRASCVTAASAPMIDSLARLGVAGRRVPLGVDLSSWAPREPQARVPGQPARLVHVASLNRVKDQPTLLGALAHMRAEGLRFSMEVIGTDTLAGAMQALASRLGLTDCVKFRGFLPQRDLRTHVAEADLMLVSSRHEAGPVAVLEAAVLGVPTVGSAVGHIAEWAPRAARAVPPADPLALAHQARALLLDEKERLRVAREAWRLATKEDADHTARKFEAIYTELANGRS